MRGMSAYISIGTALAIPCGALYAVVAGSARPSDGRLCDRLFVKTNAWKNSVAFTFWNICSIFLLLFGVLAQALYVLRFRRAGFAAALAGAAAVGAAALHDRDIVLLVGQAGALPLLRALRGGATP